MLLKDIIIKLQELEKLNPNYPARIDVEFFDTKELDIKYYDFGYETFPNPEKQPLNNEKPIQKKTQVNFKPRKYYKDTNIKK